jgi:hypothetical protein
MARRPSPTSDLPTEVRSTKIALEQRWQALGAQFCGLLGLNAQQLGIYPDAQAGRVWAGLQGSKCERTARNRGGASSVVPLCDLPKSLAAWLGFQEVWDVETGPRPYIFRQLGLTIHFGYVGDPIKPQAFRLEWPGIRDWNGAGPTFQTPGAGHPHWQFDILESLAKLEKSEAADVFEPEEIELVEEFGANSSLSIGPLVSSISMEGMHFASGARWWVPRASESIGQHMNAPPDPAAEAYPVDSG